MKPIHSISLLLILSLMVVPRTQSQVDEPTLIHPLEDETYKVVRLYEEAEQGNAKSQLELGIMFEEGHGVPSNKDSAIHWYLQSASQGHPPAQSLLGLKYETGDLVDKDEEEAIKWYTKAAAQDDPWAQSSLGYRIIMGKSTHKDFDEGLRLLQLAAEQGQPHAQYYLGICFRNGLGVETDRIQAYLWFNLSAAQKSNLQKKALENREELEREMIPVQIAEAQQLTTAFISHPIRSNSAEFHPIIKSIGSGFFISANGYLLTNYHVIEDAKNLTVRTNRGPLPAELITTDPKRDLALLKVTGHFDPIPLGNSRDVKIETGVRTVRFPNFPVSSIGSRFLAGRITALEGFQKDPFYFQVSTPITPGNSGAPLIDELGNVLGVVVARKEASAMYKITGEIPEDAQYAMKIGYCMDLLTIAPEVSESMPRPIRPGDPVTDINKKLEASSVIVYAWE